MNVLRRGGLLINLIGQIDRVAAREAGLRALAFEMKYSTRDLADIAELVAEGLLQPRISAVLPLAEARRALDMNQHNESHGKIVLRMAA
jgi:NADPH:quinone reductase-like Zn-dependent oxidoreductase